MSKKILLLFLIVSIFTGCSSETPEEKRQAELKESTDKLAESLSNFGESLGNNAEGSVADVMSQMSNALGQMQKDNKIKEPVNFRELRKHLPERLADMERTDQEGKTTGMMGFKLSTAKATYKKGDQMVEASVVDAGGLGAAMMGMAAWSAIDLDEENSRGFKRTLQIDGNKAYQECNTRQKSCQLSMIVAHRFIVTLEGDNVGIDDLMNMMKRMDVSDLADLG